MAVHQMHVLGRHHTLVIQPHQVRMPIDDQLFDGRHVDGLIGHDWGVLLHIQQQTGVDFVDDVAHHPRLMLMLLEQERDHVAPNMV